MSLSVPPDGPGAESCPPSHPRPPTHCKEKARLLQRLPAEVQLTGEQVFLLKRSESSKVTSALQEVHREDAQGITSNRYFVKKE